jgi:hypothetical protein
MKEYEIGRECSTNGGDYEGIGDFWSKSHKDRDH